MNDRSINKPRLKETHYDELLTSGMNMLISAIIAEPDPLQVFYIGENKVSFSAVFVT